MVCKYICEKSRAFNIFFILAVLIVGNVYSVLPHSLRYNELKDKGLQYIPLTKISDFDIMNVHGARYRDMIDGKIISGEVDTYEHKDGPAIWPLFSATLLAPFFIPFDTIFPGLIITDFVFPIFTFLSFFLIINALTNNRFFALFSALLLLLFPQLPHYIPPASFTELKLLTLQFLPLPFFNIFTVDLTYLGREAFIPGAPFFILSIYFIYQAVHAETKKRFFTILAGIFYGLLFYLYFYFWVFATIFLGLFFLGLLIRGKTREARTIFTAGVIGLIVSLPFWVSHLNLAHLPQYKEIIERMAPEIGYEFRWFLWKTYLLVFFIIGIASWFGQKFNMPVRFLFLSALAFSAIVVLNIQVVTGFNIQSDHWSGRVFLITNGIIWATLFYYTFLYLKDYIGLFKTKYVSWGVKAVPIVAVTIVASLLSNIIFTELIFSRRYALSYSVNPNLMQGYEWLNNNTPKDSVIMSPSLDTNIDIPVYTHNRIFLARAQNTIASEGELLERLNFAYALLGISLAYLDEMIQSNEGVFYFFTAKYNSRALDSSLRAYKYINYALPLEMREHILRGYVNYKIPEQFPYKVDYIFIGPREREIGIKESLLGNYEKIYDTNGVQIYSMSLK